ncbi:MAG: hypothetical protein JO082_10565 [Mycobacterium sp.]|nr:hypothetical protein [Mycobacterium sp.]MBV9722348.1 hypothetical protein [Mycobacterium sp.]
MDDSDGPGSASPLETHIREFLTAVNTHPGELLGKHLAELEKPDPQDTEDLRRYINDLKRIYGQGLLDMYRRIALHGSAICELTDETEITERVEQITTLIALDRDDVPTILASFDAAAKELTREATVRLFLTIQNAGVRGLPRQVQRDELVLDFTTYCLSRFPPADN